MVIEVDRSLTGSRVVEVLKRLALTRSLPQGIRSDNGPEFVGKTLDQWAFENKVRLDLIESRGQRDHRKMEDRA